MIRVYPLQLLSVIPCLHLDAVDMLVGILSRAGDYWRLGGANAPDFQAFLALPAFDKHLLSLHQHVEP